MCSGWRWSGNLTSQNACRWFQSHISQMEFPYDRCQTSESSTKHTLDLTWSPHMDIQVLEKVQQRATNCVCRLKNKTYQQRLIILGIPSLELRRKRGDLIETYKILTGKEDIDRDQLFQLTPNIHSTRGRKLKLFEKPCRINVRKFFFSQRQWTVGTLFHPMLWNLLPSTRSRTDWMTTSLEMDACFSSPSSTSNK